MTDCVSPIFHHLPLGKARWRLCWEGRRRQTDRRQAGFQVVISISGSQNLLALRLTPKISPMHNYCYANDCCLNLPRMGSWGDFDFLPWELLWRTAGLLLKFPSAGHLALPAVSRKRHWVCQRPFAVFRVGEEVIPVDFCQGETCSPTVNKGPLDKTQPAHKLTVWYSLPVRGTQYTHFCWALSVGDGSVKILK
jgi:hypothetical protein